MCACNIVTTPRRARKKGKKNNTAATSPDKNSTIGGVGDSGGGGDGRGCGLENSPTEDTKQTRSRSRGRKILDAAVARISFGRSRSKSIPKSNSRGIEISGPIVGTRITSEVFGPSVFLKQNSVTESDQNGHVRGSHDQTNDQSQFPLNSAFSLNPAEREQLLRTPQSWEGNSVSSVPLVELLCRCRVVFLISIIPVMFTMIKISILTDSKEVIKLII
ncbi:hypothetical protein FBUS_03498 [Fasciolopsis buskii]|uniref:Uncharacterized protein n=1 Tax=Fasciolopsis buskii TaxID=27845 RepID=A0A8E0VJ98_9TREM|nr:hypothetical protein FBUS_03498 [Fasciolopsis buski]